MDRAKAIERIQKLLAIARSTPHWEEAQTAIATANKILLEHNLSMATVEAAEVEGTYQKERVPTGGRIPTGSEFVEWILDEFFFVRIVICLGPHKAIELFGRPENVAVARYVYVYLVRIFDVYWRVHRRKNSLPAKERRNFYLGLQLGVAKRLNEERKSVLAAEGAKNALVRVKRDLVVAHRNAYGELGSIRSGRVDGKAEVFLAGVDQGQKIELRKPLPGSAAQPKRIGVSDPSI